MHVSRAARLAALFLIVALTCVARVSAHDIPRDVTVQAFAKPEDHTFRLLVRVPLKAIMDMNRREIAVFLPLVLITLWMGVYPNSFLDPMAPAVDKLIGDYNAALKLARTAALP